MTTTTLIIIFLSVYFAQFFLDRILSFCNIRYQKQHPTPPAIFSGHISQDRYESSQAYTRAYYLYNAIFDVVHAILFIAFIYAGLLNGLDAVLREYISSDIHRGVLFFIILSGISWVVNIPFDLYSTFVIEEKFGFNKQTGKIWMLDQMKSMLLSAVLMLPLGYAVLGLMQFAGTYWWLYSWGLFFAYSLFIAQIYPIWIAPIFNKFTPLENGELRDKIQTLSQKVNFPMNNIYVMDETQRSKHSNAYFAGFGKNKRLVLYDTLIQEFTTDEILVIVAHEMGHHHKKHIMKQLVTSQITTITFLYLLSIAIHHPYLYQTFLVQNFSSYMGLLLLTFLVSPIMSFLSPIFHYQSWKYETESDRYALEITGLSEPAKTMFIKLATTNLSNLTPHPVYARWYYSHPPIYQRLQNLNLDK